MTHTSSKVGGCGIGNLVHDYALGRNGIVVGGPWVETTRSGVHSPVRDLAWEWEVLYDDGELMGADTNDLKVIHESR